ncbi:hypothetical protein [Nocardiopsis sp. YSL2]|uniref:hypothetical protein n=1 Tax=Nocardiopsis sp. YSL2 TaxID=2939492 RepID=UPI0026F42810|nr:hypothetical protein [Nocardiopsis sp. YSL2]
MSDGRTPFEVFRDVRFLGNSRLAPCSHLLKQAPCRRWLEANADPDETVLYVGYDHTEERRVPGTRKGWEPWQVQFPMTEPPHLTKDDMFAWCRDLGITPPRLYRWADHNNCWGRCARGKKHWSALWANDPAGFAEAEAAEQGIRDHLGKPVTILREVRRGEAHSLTLAELRQRLENEAEVPR